MTSAERKRETERDRQTERERDQKSGRGRYRCHPHHRSNRTIAEGDIVTPDLGKRKRESVQNRDEIERDCNKTQLPSTNIDD